MTPIALTIAGSDSSGGAGIQADLKTFAAYEVYGASVITSVTAQNTRGVGAIHDIPADIVAAQIDAVFSDLDVGAVKIGMLSQAATIAAVAAGLARHRAKMVVLDPVMVASTGARLIAADALAALREWLIPRALLLTPNLPEAAALLDAAVATSEAEMQAQAERLLALGPRAVLIKGGHGDGAESVVLLVEAPDIPDAVECRGEACLAPTCVTRFAAPRISTRNTHGTGCTLSSAVAAGLAKGAPLAEAVRAAKAYVTAAIVAADTLAVGHGHGPVHHFHHLWRAA
jgi:hydroxymethylpyrimidine/phosphomethylpyrimidine kinase